MATDRHDGDCGAGAGVGDGVGDGGASASFSESPVSSFGVATSAAASMLPM